MIKSLFVHSSAISLFVITGVIGSNAQVYLNLEPGVELSWPTVANNTYQLQWSPNSSGAWNALGTSVPGDGTTNLLYDPVLRGTRSYQVLEMVPGSAPVSATLTNGGFESGSGDAANNWPVTQAAGGPVYAVRTNTNPHNGSYNFEVHLASTGAGPVVGFAQANIPVTGGTTYPFTFYSSVLPGSAGQSPQWKISWNAGGDTGFHGFTPGNNTYAFVSNSVTAPLAATSATISFYIAGAASASQSATIDLDDVVLGSTGGSSSGSPGATNILPVVSQPVAKVSWPTTTGTQYQPESTTNLATEIWDTNFPVVIGDGSTRSIMFPLTNSPLFFRLYIPPVVILPPANLHQIASGFTNAIGLAWTASTTPGVTGYRILFNLTSGGVTNSMDVGNVNSAILPDLTPGQTYYVAVITLTANGQSPSASAAITAQPDTAVGIVPLFDASTPLEPETTVDTPTALITHLADRARDRHARESDFQLYDHYLSWYWEQRVANIEIVDRVAKGGTDITFNYTTQAQLNPAEFRTFFRGVTTVAEYQNNQQAVLVSTNASATPGETDFNYTATISANAQYNRPLQMGDRVEVEISQFLLAPRHGRDNYYGTVFLYVVGQGVVPWHSSADQVDAVNMSNNGPVVGNVRTNIDSYPLPTNAWLGGKTTLPYQYSDEPQHRFKETAGNISPANGELFMLGRRLHHTDFGNGTHSEPDNPVFTEQIGKLGPKFINRSCVACHVNNGRALPPAIGTTMLQSVVHVASDANGTPDPVLGSILQPQITSGTPEGGVTIGSYTTTDGTYADGTPYTLQKPNYIFSGHTPAFYSVRIAPQLVGMGLLEAVGESTIMDMADPDDADHDGISGRVQTVIDPQTGQPRLGRFTYKAGRARVNQQVAGAFNTDMGVTTSIFPVLDGETTAGTPELADDDLDKLTRYVALLGVGARRSLTDPQCLKGEQLFASANCVKCHAPTLTTSPYHPMTELRNQIIHPYTDLLLHDMGPGLADNLGEGNASGSEWRTAPLWSIGLTAGVSGGEAYLHDGRARSLEEAILWHDGEAAASKEVFRNMSASDRAALIAFLKSL